jgi:outer membrane protein OmpU
MRTILLASAAVLGANAADAQSVPIGSPTQGQSAFPLPGQSLATVNENNDTAAAPRAGPFANPTPGTIVVHINGRVETGFAGVWSSADTRAFTAPAGSPGATPITSIGTGGTSASAALGALLGNNGTGTAKLQPNTLYSYVRLYFGADAMAANGLQYGAAIEVRQNLTGEQSGASASAYSSLQTLFVRRAFTYVAGDQWGILRAGQADGIISLFDNSVTTFQYLPTNNLQNGDGYALLVPGNTSVPFFFLSQAGAEYANNKLVYLSPRFSGVDFGVQYAPNTSNGFGMNANAGGLGNSLTGSGNGTGLTCNTATSGCPSLSAGPGILDGSRIINQTAIGAQYQGSFGDVGLLAYAVYEISGHADYTGVTTASVLGNTVSGSKFTGQYDGLNFGNGGLAVSYGRFTVGGNVIGGRLNGQLQLAPQNAVSEIAFMVGAKYVAGPLVVGVAAERGNSQGAVNLTGLTQRRSQAIDVGLGYTVAPGLVVYAEYQYDTQTQGDYNFVTGAIGSSANNTVKSQGFLLGNVATF